MAEFNELANSPMTMELMGKTYKVRRVPMDTIFGKAETAVIAQQMKRIKQMADQIEEGEERTSFLAKAMLDSIPTGQKLNELTSSFLRSTEGVRMVLIDALIKDHPDIEKEIDIIELMNAEADKVTMIVKYSVGRMGRKSNGPFVEDEKGTQS